jgi:WD40 repeat protein
VSSFRSVPRSRKPSRRPRRLKGDRPHPAADGALITLGDSRIRRWSLPDLQLEREWRFPRAATLYAAVPWRSGFLAAGTLQTLWKATSVDATLERLDLTAITLKGVRAEDVAALAMLPGDERVLVCCRSTIQEIDLDRGERVRGFETREVSTMALSSDGTFLAVGIRGDSLTSLGGALHFWDLAGGTQVHASPLPNTPSTMVFLPGDQTLAVGFSSGAIRFYGRDGTPQGSLSGPADDSGTAYMQPAAHPMRIRGLVAPADGTLHSVSYGREEQGGLLRSWTVSDRSILRSIPLDDQVHSLTLRPDPGRPLVLVNPLGRRTELWTSR